MPLYEYACRACGHRFEKRLRFEERLARQSCPTCDAAETTLLLSVPAPAVSAGAAATPCGMPAPGGCCGGACMH